MAVPRYPLRALRSLPHAMPNIESTPFATLPGAGLIGRLAGEVQHVVLRENGGPERAKLVAPKTSFNGRVSAHRRFVFGQLSLDEVKAVKNAHGVTVNDVVVSICAGAVRRWLLEHDELPERAARRADPGVGAHRRPDRHLRQPHPADERAALHRHRRPGAAPAAHARRRSRR